MVEVSPGVKNNQAKSTKVQGNIPVEKDAEASTER